MFQCQIIKISKIILALLIVLIIGNTLSIMVTLFCHAIAAIINLILGIFYIIGNTLKDNMIFLAIWIIVLSKISMLPLKNIAYRSIVIIINPDEECLICF